MITGSVTADHEAVVVVQVRAPKGRPQTVEAVLDTGFTEFLALPLDRIAALGLPFRCTQRMFLADGSQTTLAAYRGVVVWHGLPLLVPVLAVDGDALVGMSLLEGSHVGMEVVAGGQVLVEPISEP
jgi:clan AA aspartic protease